MGVSGEGIKCAGGGGGGGGGIQELAMGGAQAG